MADKEVVTRNFSWEEIGDIDAGGEFTAREVDCWASGDRVCRFVVKPSDGPDGA